MSDFEREHAERLHREKLDHEARQLEYADMRADRARRTAQDVERQQRNYREQDHVQHHRRAVEDSHKAWVETYVEMARQNGRIADALNRIADTMAGQQEPK